MPRPPMRVSAATVSTPDAQRLAAFYESLLGWDRVDDEAGWVRLRPPAGGTGLSFHHDEHHRPPMWPSRPDDQQMMVHLDIATDDLDGAVAHAVSLGAVLAEHQPQERVRVLLDPDGHPFCLFAGSARGEGDIVDWQGTSDRETG